MDVIENVVRSLIREGKINRARALLSIFEDEYPHLIMEVEAAAGNWRIVERIFKTLPKEVQKDYEVLYKTSRERIKEDYSKDFKEAVSEMEKNNLEGAMALLEGITRKHPELVEAIALKYEIAKKKGEITKAKKLEEILKGLDPSHPVLAIYASRIERRKQAVSSLGNVMMLVSILLILVLSIVSLVLSPNISHFKSLESKIEGVEKYIENVLPNVKPEKNGLKAEDIDRIVRNALKEASIPGTVTVDISPIMAELSKLDRSISRLGESVEAVKSELMRLSAVSTTLVLETKATTPVLTVSGPVQLQSWEKVYKPASELDRAKIYWLAGYIMFLKGNYTEAIRLFNKSDDIVRARYPGVYFQDDCEYYRALSYYMMGDLWQAKKLFEEFISDFPESLYRDDAEYFLRRISGGA